MDNGNTAMILFPFLEGMREAGAEVELFYTEKLNIKSCRGKFNCWLKTPGICFQKDDMEMLLPKLGDSDIWVFATPVHSDGISGSMQVLWERMIPAAKPFVEIRKGHCRHPLYEGFKQGKVVLVSTCGHYELDNFDPLLSHIKTFTKNCNRIFAGALLRPHGGNLKIMMKMGIQMDDIFKAAKEGGYRLIADGKISSKILKIINRNLVSLEMYLKGVNKAYQRIFDNIKKK
jgi:multimeric flavodoxin WrbA